MIHEILTKPHLKFMLIIGLSLSEVNKLALLGYFTWVFRVGSAWGGVICFNIDSQIIPHHKLKSSAVKYLGGLGSMYNKESRDFENCRYRQGTRDY